MILCTRVSGPFFTIGSSSVRRWCNKSVSNTVTGSGAETFHGRGSRGDSAITRSLVDRVELSIFRNDLPLKKKFNRTLYARSCRSPLEDETRKKGKMGRN